MPKVGDAYFTSPLRITDSGTPITNLTDADFTKHVYLNGVLQSTVVTVSHLANGNYQGRFIPDHEGSWVVVITQDTYAPDGWAEAFWVREHPLKVGDTYYTGPLRVVDENNQPVTSLTSADFTRQVYLNGIPQARTVTLQHLFNGNYQARFVPNYPGAWTVILAQPTYVPDGWAESAEIISESSTPSDDQTDIEDVEPLDFRNYFQRDFKYMPVYNNNKVYFQNDVVSLTVSDATNFYQLLVENSQGVSPLEETDPPTWGPINFNSASFILDTDIQKALDQAKGYINPALFDVDQIMIDAFLYCSAHYLVMDMGMAESGIDNRAEGVISSKSVGGVSVGYDIPEAFRSDPQFAYFATTAYGRKFLSYVLPRAVGLPGVAYGDTLP
jgi:hypothetical protein